jgi:RsiW-degrading membrane proteinase PrsW (M82 family)
MVILFVISLISMVLCFYVAKYRHANKTLWVLAALLIGPLAVPFVFFSKPVTSHS